MPRTKNTDGLAVALGASVLQWGIDRGFGDQTVSSFYAFLTGKKKATKKKATKKKATKKKATKKKATKKKATKKKRATAPKKKTAKKKRATAPKKKTAKKKRATTAKKKTAKKKATKASKRTSAYDPQDVVKFIEKHGQAKAGDLKGLVPDNSNARALFLGDLVKKELIRREGKARGTTYFPV